MNCKCSFKIPISEMDTEIQIQNRDIKSLSEQAGFTEEFTDHVETQAKVQTLPNGKTEFNGVGQEEVITHRFSMRYEPGITSESWILLNNIRYDIVRSINVDEKNRYLILNCNVKGKDTSLANLV